MSSTATTASGTASTAVATTAALQQLQYSTAVATVAARTVVLLQLQDEGHLVGGNHYACHKLCGCDDYTYGMSAFSFGFPLWGCLFL